MNIIHMKTDHDINGNPQRLFIVHDDEQLIRVIVEGYGGRQELRQMGLAHHMDVEIFTHTDEYDRWVERGERKGVIVYQ